MVSSASNFTLALTGSLTTAWDGLYGPELVWSLSGIMQCGLTHMASESDIQGATLAVIRVINYTVLSSIYMKIVYFVVTHTLICMFIYSVCECIGNICVPVCIFGTK